MIKLIASDLDGSLLNDEKKLAPEFFDIFGELKRRGIHFVAASGRTYSTLRHNFHPVSEEMDFICENGACVVMGGAYLRQETLKMEELSGVFQVCRTIPDIQLVLCGTKSAYHLDYPPAFDWHIKSYHINHTIVSDLTDVKDEIYKVAICDLNRPERNSFPILDKQFGKQFSLRISGDYWMDIMRPGVNKGNALMEIQSKLGVTEDETMAFGDYYNDIELLRHAKYSFVMENANEDMRQYGRYIAKSNNENGVLEAVKEYVLKQRR